MDNPIISLPDNPNAKEVYDYLFANRLKSEKELDGVTLPVGLVQIIIGRLAKKMQVGRPTIQHWLDRFEEAGVIVRPGEEMQRVLVMHYAPKNSNWFILTNSKSYDEISTKKKARKAHSASTLSSNSSALLAIAQARLTECLTATYNLAKLAGNRPSASSLAYALSPCMLNFLSLCKLLLSNNGLYAAIDSSANSSIDADNDLYAALGIGDSAAISDSAANTAASGIDATAATSDSADLSATAACRATVATSAANDLRKLATTGLLPTTVQQMVSSLATWMQNLTQESNCCTSGVDRARTRPAPKLEQVLDFAASEGISRESAEAFFYHYDSTGWVSKTGQPLKSWKGRLLRWVADDKARDERLMQAGKHKKASELAKIETIKAIVAGTIDPTREIDRAFIRNGGMNPDEFIKYKPD